MEPGLNYGNVRKTNFNEQFVSCRMNLPVGFHEKCDGCYHSHFDHEMRMCTCKYVTHPKMRKFPCFFREHVAPKDGATALNLAEVPEPVQTRRRRSP